MDRQAVQRRFGIVGASPAIGHVIDRTRLVARTDITVLIEGESGVGKELFANAIHELSHRRHRPLKVINTGAIPEGLIESELFGAERGAYTGASERRKGLFEEADGGSVFLDEIGEMPHAAQVRLLRVLESGSFNRVGSSEERRTDARVIAATNKNLGKEVEAGNFREDLYYRLSTVIIHVPPLRERAQDILPLFETFLFQLSQKYRTPNRRLDEAAKDVLRRYRWPGNVRELKNVAEQVVVLHRQPTVSADAVRPLLRGVTAGKSLLPVRRAASSEEPDSFRERELIYGALLDIRLGVRELRKQVTAIAGGYAENARMGEFDTDRAARSVPLLHDSNRREWDNVITYEEVDPGGDADASEEIPTLADAERALILKALRLHGNSKRRTAKALGISERTLYRKLKDMSKDGAIAAESEGVQP